MENFIFCAVKNDKIIKLWKLNILNQKMEDLSLEVLIRC